MWTATVKEKGTEPRGTYVDVEFTDGTTSSVERCIPQDLVGFKSWVKGRLATFNCQADLDATYNVNDPVTFTEQTLTQDEIDFNTWMRNFGRLQRVQQLIDLGIVPTNNPKVVALRNTLTSTLKAEYIDRL